MKTGPKKDEKDGFLMMLFTRLFGVIESLGSPMMRYLIVLLLILFGSVYIFRENINPYFGVGVILFVVLFFGILMRRIYLAETKIEYLSRKEALYKESLRDTVLKLQESRNVGESNDRFRPPAKS